MNRGNYILTYTNKKFYPMDPRIEEIDAKDIAHALSLLCRANGHYKHFYSVAEHSIYCYREAETRGYSLRVQLACLLHDASEAYIADITRPVKSYLPEYLNIEELIQNKVWEAFGLGELSEEEVKKVKEIDDAILYYEFLALHGSAIYEEAPFITTDYLFTFKPMEEVEKEFMVLLKKLIK